MASENTTQNISVNTIKTLIIGSYAWLAAISFGLVLLDIVYANLAPDASTAFREVADFLLFINALTILASLGAIGSSMNTKSTRNFLAVSLGLTISGFLLYAVFSPLLESGSQLGPVLRIILRGSASVFAFVGFYMYSRESYIKR